MDKRFFLLGPSNPALGMRSAQDPSVLPGGIWSRLENLRCDNGTLRVRDGAISVVTSALDSGAVCKGLHSCTVDGVNYFLGAFRWGGSTRVYRLSGTSWSGPIATFATDGDVGFAVVRDQGVTGGVSSAADTLVMGVTGESPRIAYGASLAGQGTQIGLPVPAWATQTAMPYGWMQLAPANVWEDSTGSGYTALNVTGPSISVSTPVADSTAVFTFHQTKLYDETTLTAGLTLQKEVCFATPLDDGGGYFWDYTQKVELLVNPTSPTSTSISNATNATPIVVTTGASHGLTTGDYVRVASVLGNTAANGHWRVTVTSGTTFELDDSAGTGAYTSGGAVTELEWITVYDTASVNDTLNVQPLRNISGVETASMAAILTGSFEGRTGWGGVRFTANGEEPDGGGTFAFYIIATSGQMDGRALFAVSYFNSGSRSEGVALEATSGSGKSLQSFGGRAAGGQYRWEPSLFRTSYLIEFPGSDDLAGTPNYALIYRSDPYISQDGATLFTEYFYSGHKTLPTSEPLGGNDKYVVSTADDDITRVAQNAGAMVTPSGNLFCSVNDRLFVSGTSNPSELWVSGDRRPFVFRQVPTTDDSGNQSPTSATYRTFAGESVTALRRIQGDILGVDSILLWTNRGLYRLGGYDSRTILQAASLSEKGTLRAQTVCLYDGMVLYLDTEGQIRMSNGGLASQPMSLNRIDDQLSSGVLSGACAVAGFYHYRMFFQEEGASSVRVAATWQQATGEWVLDRYPFDIGQVCLHDVSPSAIMYAAEPNGKLWRLEVPKQETEGGSKIPVRMDGPELSEGLWSPMVFKAMGIVMDGNVDATITTTRTVPLSGSTYTGTIDLSVSALTTASAWRYDTLRSGTEKCFSCIPKIEGALPGGRRIRALVVNATATNAGGPDRA